jgi:hypothetical protein
MSETIVYRGIKFRRYPESDNWADRMYYVPGHADKIRGIRRLHEEIYRDHNGPIPPGHHIHHVDFDQLNNDHTNLVALSPADHVAAHAGTREVTPEMLAHLESIRPLAAEWHGSPEGIEWHRQHGIAVAASRVAVEATCYQCGSTYESTMPGRFCSNKCKSAWRRDSGVDDEQRACVVCGTSFTVNRYSKKRACGRPCGGVIANRRG